MAFTVPTFNFSLCYFVLGPRGFVPQMGVPPAGNRGPPPLRGPMGPPRPLMMGMDGSGAEESNEEEVERLKFAKESLLFDCLCANHAILF